MGQKTIEVTEYNCERCGYKWIARHGQNKGEPNFCPKYKTCYWNLERNMEGSKEWLKIAHKQRIAKLIRLNSRHRTNK